MIVSVVSYFLYLFLLGNNHFFVSANICSDRESQTCLQKVGNISIYETMILNGDLESISLLCGKYIESLLCVDRFAKDCLDERNRRIVLSMLAGPKLFIVKVCRAGAYQDRYLNLGKCLRKINMDLLTLCTDEIKFQIGMVLTQMKHLNDMTKRKIICQNIREFQSCMKIDLSNQCEDIDSNFFQKVIHDLVSPFELYACYYRRKIARTVIKSKPSSSKSLISSINLLFFIVITQFWCHFQ